MKLDKIHVKYIKSDAESILGRLAILCSIKCIVTFVYGSKEDGNGTTLIITIIIIMVHK